MTDANETGLGPACQNCGNPCSSGPSAGADVGSRMRVGDSTSEIGNEHAAAVAQQDATEPWVPWPWIVLGLVFCLGVDFGVFLGVWQAMRRVLC
jgi:hypothetical protein